MLKLPKAKLLRIKYLLSGSIILLILIISGIRTLYLNTLENNSAQTIVVEMRNDGFYPPEVRINIGDAVNFINKTDKSFWPASNLHPTHEIYPEFDPKQPIDSGKGWSFKFTKIGEWKYHDHLSPINKGVIYVSYSKSNSLPSTWSNCEKLNNNVAKQQCWQSLLEEELKSKGLEQGFLLFKKIYAQSPSDCHQYAHSLGEVAYKQYLTIKKVSLSEETDYCGFGFWHGFMGALMKDNQDNPKKAGDFCEYIKNQPNSGNSVAMALNCYHGLGIGLIEDPPNPKVWGNAKAMRSQALKICEQVIGQDGDKLGNCLSGVFHATIDFMLQNKYGLSFDKKAPFQTCLIEVSKNREPCYLQIASKLYSAAQGNLYKMAGFIQNLPETDLGLKKRITQLAFFNVVNQNITAQQFSKYLNDCENIFQLNSQDCINGMVRGLFQTAEPGNEYSKVLDICNSTLLSEEDKIACMDNVFKYVKNNNSEAKFKQLCQKVNENLRPKGC